MDMGIPPLNIKILFASNTLRSRIFVRRLAATGYWRHSNHGGANRGNGMFRMNTSANFVRGVKK